MPRRAAEERGRCASLKGSPGRSGGDRAEFNAVELGRDFPTLAEQIVIGLKTKPEPIGQPEVPRQEQVRVGGYRSFARDDLVNASW